MYHHFCILLMQQLLGPLGGGLGYHDRHRHAEFATGVCHCQAGVATGRGDEVPRTTGMVDFAGMAHPAQLERTAGLQGVELEPDRSAGGQR